MRGVFLWLSKHIFANGEPVATVQGSTTTANVLYIHDDHLTGASVLSNASGTVAEVLEYYPFGGGNRRCVGASFAMLHMKVMLSTLMKTVTFRRPGSARLRVQQRGATLGPSRRLRLTVEAVHR